MDVDNLNDYLCATQAGERTFTDTANDLLPYHPRPGQRTPNSDGVTVDRYA